jgi:tetratricopeptide (TPR) repeat protein
MENARGDMTPLDVQQSFDRALQLHRAGRLQEAELLYRQIRAQDPGHAGATHYLGMIAYQMGDRRTAIELLRKAVALRDDWPEAYSNLGNLLQENGQSDEAIASCRRAISLRPDYAEACNNLGLALEAKGQIDDAIAALRHAIALKPDIPEAYNNLGNAQRGKGELDAAIASFRRAIALRPGFAAAYNNLGTALMDKARFAEAADAFRAALAARGDYANAHSNLGTALKEAGDIDGAIAAFGNAIQLHSDFAEAHANLGMALLAKGDFEKGWREYEWRCKCAQVASRPRNFTQPQWDRSRLNGRRILLYPEQGLGDAIQFIRYLPLVVAQGGKVIIECPPSLARLVQTAGWDCQIVIQGESLPEFDLHCPLLSLPGVFGTTEMDVPNAVPYLEPAAEDVSKWRHLMERDRAAFNIGLVWAGRRDHKSDRSRATEIGQWAVLSQIPGVRVFSLRKKNPGEIDENMPAGVELIDRTDEIQDFADTAALIANLDLIISVDTAAAHLAGAMGRPVWTLLRFAPDWRWLRDREDSPWYPTMRLFRQQTPGDWREAISRIVDALRSARSLGSF